MKRVLRVAATFASWQVLAVLALFCADMALLGWYQAKIAIFFLSLLGYIGLYTLLSRIRNVAGSGIWRMLPDGNRIFVRALALTMFVLAILLGGLGTWAVPQLIELPLGHILIVYVYLSALGAVSIAGLGQRMPGYFVTILAVAALAALSACYEQLPFPWLWWPIALACAAGWIVASCIELPFLRRGSARRRRSAIVPASAKLFAGLRNWLLLSNSPARAILHAERSGLGNLFTAALVSIGWALFIHANWGYRYPVDSYRVVASTNALVLATTVFFMAYGMAARVRPLWLRCGNSRAALFRLAERSLLLDLVVLSLVAWGAVTGLALLRDLPIGGTEALAALLRFAACALAPLYLGLWIATLHRWWQQLPAAIFGVVLIGTSPGYWRKALGGDLPFSSNGTGLLIGLIVLCLVLRALGSWRWRTIDWARFRPAPRVRHLRSTA